MGAAYKSAPRVCAESGRVAVAWVALSAPWTPPRGARVPTGHIQALLAESAAMLVEAADLIKDRTAKKHDPAAVNLARKLRAAAAEYTHIARSNIR